MYRQISPNKWSCLPTAFAQLLNIGIKELIDFIGHDGSEIIFPDDLRGDPYTRRSFNIQEIIDFVLQDGIYTVTEITEPLESFNGGTLHIFDERPERIPHYMSMFSGVLLGMSQNDVPHAVTWHTQIAYDVNGMVYSVKDSFMSWFKPNTFYIVK